MHPRDPLLLLNPKLEHHTLRAGQPLPAHHLAEHLQRGLPDLQRVPLVCGHLVPGAVDADVAEAVAARRVADLLVLAGLDAVDGPGLEVLAVEVGLEG